MTAIQQSLVEQSLHSPYLELVAEPVEPPSIIPTAAEEGLSVNR